jgi:hypothetical protein
MAVTKCVWEDEMKIPLSGSVGGAAQTAAPEKSNNRRRRSRGCNQALRITVLLGRNFCGLKSPPSSTHVLMKTGYLPASLSSY